MAEDDGAMDMAKADEGKGKSKRKGQMPAKIKRDNAIQGNSMVEDVLTPGTNDSSIVSKRSVERTGYDIKSVKDEWFRYFVKKPVRRAPLINLGYFIRMKAVENVIDKVRFYSVC
jgi:tRNA wybutosine-synthesizing protein 4